MTAVLVGDPSHWRWSRVQNKPLRALSFEGDWAYAQIRFRVRSRLEAAVL